MILSEEEKNRIRGLHKKPSTLNEQEEEVKCTCEDGSVVMRVGKDTVLEDIGGMTSDPRIMAREYGTKEISRDEIIKNLWQVQTLLSEGAPAIALRRVTELLEKLGEDIEFSQGEYNEQKRYMNEQTSEELEGDVEKKIDVIRNTQKTMVDKIDDVHKILTKPSKPWNK